MLVNKALKKLSKESLEMEYNATKQQIDEIGCFGMKDLYYLEALEREIDRRELSVHSSYKLS